jgi:hypothetical protein
MRALIGVAGALFCLWISYMVVSSGVRSLVGAWRFGQINSGVGRTAYRRLEPLRYWSIVVWQAWKVIFGLLPIVGLAVVLIGRLRP